MLELPYVEEEKPSNLSLLVTGSVLNLYLKQKKSSQVNVLLGFLPNSHRQIESEIMRQLMLNNKISEIVNSEMQTKGFEILKNRESVGSLSETEFSSDDMH